MPRPESVQRCPDCNFATRGPYAISALRLHRMRKVKFGLHPHRPLIDSHISKPGIDPRGFEKSFNAQASSEPTEYTQTQLARELGLKSNSDLSWHGKRGHIPKGHRREGRRYYTASEAQAIRDFYATKPPRIRGKAKSSKHSTWKPSTPAERSPNVHIPDTEPPLNISAEAQAKAAEELQERAERAAAEHRLQNHTSYLYGYLSRSIEDYARSSGLSESQLTQALAGLLQGRKMR